MEFVYVFKEYPFYEASKIRFISDNLEKTIVEFDKIIKKEGYGYIIEKYPLNVFCDCWRCGETIKHIEFRENGIFSWDNESSNWVKESNEKNICDK